MLPPVIVAALVIVLVAEMSPPVSKLPPVTLPLTLRLVNVPTVVKLENITLLLRVLPVNALASTLLAVTPVNCDPLPIKKLPVTLPVALTTPPVNTLPPWMLPVALKLVPVAAPMLGVVRLAPALTIILPPPSKAVVLLSILALNS